MSFHRYGTNCNEFMIYLYATRDDSAFGPDFHDSFANFVVIQAQTEGIHQCHSDDHRIGGGHIGHGEVCVYKLPLNVQAKLNEAV